MEQNLKVALTVEVDQLVVVVVEPHLVEVDVPVVKEAPLEQHGPVKVVVVAPLKL